MTSIHPTADKVTGEADRRAAYLRELIAMPDIIETDYPSGFDNLPRSRKDLRLLREKSVKRIGY